MEQFCKSIRLERKDVCFYFKGKEVFESTTPESIGMKGNDVIQGYDRLNSLS